MTTLRSAAEIADVIREYAGSSPRAIIGIAGAPGAGKSTVAAEVVALLGAGTALLPMDGFHRTQAELVALGRRERMGAPDTFDVDGLLRLLQAIAVGNPGTPLRAPGFDREREEPVPGAIDVSPEFSTVVIEGNYLLLDEGGWEAIAGHLDLTFFLEVDDGERQERLIARHIRFGKSPADATAWTLGPDEANARIIAATAARADYLVRLGSPGA